MWTENGTVREDLERAASAEFIPWEELRDSTVLVTGATGLVGYTLVNVLLYAGRTKGLNLKVLALVRDEARARERFAGQLREASDLSLVVGTVEELPEIEGAVDYIVHGASPTASRTFVEKPVEVIRTAVEGTDRLLKLAREKRVRALAYLSSMEMYGYPEHGHKVTEDEAGALSPLDVRNSYPIGKQMCEALCCAYAKEYGVPAKIARLTQTFGPGVNYDDNRIFAYFGRCVKEKKDIVLKTKGETERSYLYTADAAAAILTVLLKGEAGAAYNCADEDTYCSIAQMAEKVARSGGVRVRYEIRDAASCGYPKTLYMDLDTGRLKALGWRVVCGGGYCRDV